jgi:hypothetical protein
MKSRQLVLGVALVVVCVTALALLWGPSLWGSGPPTTAAANDRAVVDSSAPVMKIHTVQAGTAEALARSLQERFRKSPTLRIAAAGGNRIVVYGSPADHDAVASHLSAPTSRTVPAEAIMRPYIIGPLNEARAEDVVKVLRQLYPPGAKSAMTIAADPRTNQVIVRCSTPEYEEVRKLVERLDIKVEKKRHTPRGQD